MKQFFKLSFMSALILTSNTILSMNQQLVPDDIANPTRWINLALQSIAPSGITDKIKLRNRQGYRPPVVNANNLIVFVVIHGAWCADDDNFYRDVPTEAEPLPEQNYRHIKRFASWYSTVKKQRLEQLSLQWSGSLTDDARNAASALLYRLFSEVVIYHNAHVVLLAHSHGGNVANLFSNTIPRTIPHIEMLVYFGTPKKNEREYQPRNYKMLLYFYSDSDWIMIAGRNDNKSIAIGVGGAVGTFALGSAGVYVGCRLKGPSGAVLGGALGVGIGVAATAVVFKCCLDGTNDFTPQDGTITCGFRVKHDAYNTNHHHITDTVEILPELLEKIVRNYKYHFLFSSKFHLNIDKRPHVQDPLFLVLFPVVAPNEVPEEMPNLIRNNNNDVIDDGFNVRQRNAEKGFSVAEAQRYENHYMEEFGPLDITENYATEMAYF